MTSLYGVWQTDPWTAPRAEGGRVPRNERGNVECPPLVAALPGGTVHLVLPAAAAVARTLEIDVAPALVGFEMQGGRMVPKIEGVVVCEVGTSRGPAWGPADGETMPRGGLRCLCAAKRRLRGPFGSIAHSRRPSAPNILGVLGVWPASGGLRACVSAMQRARTVTERTKYIPLTRFPFPFSCTVYRHHRHRRRQEFAELLEAACLEREGERRRREAEKRLAEGRAAWVRLLTGLRTRLKLQQQYEQPAVAATAAAGLGQPGPSSSSQPQAAAARGGKQQTKSAGGKRSNKGDAASGKAKAPPPPTACEQHGLSAAPLLAPSGAPGGPGEATAAEGQGGPAAAAAAPTAWPSSAPGSAAPMYADVEEF